MTTTEQPKGAFAWLKRQAIYWSWPIAVNVMIGLALWGGVQETRLSAAQATIVQMRQLAQAKCPALARTP